MDHARIMERCLALAERGRGRVGINPLVGAVLVRDGTMLAEDHYSGFGKTHAERSLLESVILRPSKDDQKISSYIDSTRDDTTLYLNLEPCCHHGRTPPCTDIIIEKGIKRVVVGMIDPDPRVAGKGIAALRAAGIEVIGPVLRARCERLNRGFISVRRKGRPYVTLKRAQTIDGAVANPDGSRLCITSSDQNVWSHTRLRSTHDAILVGVQTVHSDDPALTIRLNKKYDQNFPQPYRIIFDPDLRIPLSAKVVGEKTIVVTKVVKNSKDAKEHQLIAKGAEVLHVPFEAGHFDWDALWKFLITPSDGFAGISSILVEGGSKTWATFRDAGCVDEEVTLVGDRC